MDDYNATNDEANKSILQKLAEDCEEEDTAAVIRCYSIGATGADIRKEMNKHKVGPLKKSAIYLGLYPKGDTKNLKTDIITDVITRLNSLLMDLCGACGVYFNNTLAEKPLFSCMLCHQGCHNDCFEPIYTMFNALDANQKKAIQFICTSCYSDHNEGDEEITVNAPKVKKSPSKESQPPPSQENHEHEENSSLVTPDPGTPITNEVIIVGGSDGDSHQIQIENTDDDPTKISVCPAYKWGRCPEYDTCQYRHPPRCWNWLTNGKCSFRKKCRYHHPPLCRNSLWEKKCFTPECKFFHTSKTMRYRMEDEQLKNSLHPANYDSQFPQLLQPQHGDPTIHQQNHVINTQQKQQLPPPPPINYRPQQAQQPPQVIPQNQYQSPSNQMPPVNLQQQPNSHNNQPPNARSSFSLSAISFLAQTIKEVLKDDLAKEIATMKRELTLEIQNANRTPMTPMMYGHPVSGQVRLAPV